MPEQESLKQRIHHGDSILGVSVPIQIDRRRLETILSQDAYEFVAVDSQHSPLLFPNTHNHMRERRWGIREPTSSPIIRLRGSWPPPSLLSTS